MLRSTAVARIGFVLAGLFVCGGARAQTTINIWPGVAPGSEHWNWKEKVFHDVVNDGQHLGTIIDDVVTPTLTIYLPNPGKATGTAVVIAPGGACIALTMDIEGADVARRLQQKGIAAFVLKYRLKHKLVQGMPKNLSEDEACQWGIADAVQALSVVRRHAGQWHLSPHRIGIIGFSAGGMLASEALVQENPALRPDFAALIYGAPFESMPAIPARLPPVFMAWAQDDNTAGYAMVRFYKALMKAGDKPEAHIYHMGGHGFASSTRPGSTSAHWLQEFVWWLKAKGLVHKPD
ncbi:MAG TPA: alpha/beta hydrolase [Rhodanobacteraceae bacterium]|nr:alpha/beta hydrolase [Rhodanobacteraceae bacterium]